MASQANQDFLYLHDGEGNLIEVRTGYSNFDLVHTKPTLRAEGVIGSAFGSFDVSLIDVDNHTAPYSLQLNVGTYSIEVIDNSNTINDYQFRIRESI